MTSGEIRITAEGQTFTAKGIESAWSGDPVTGAGKLFAGFFALYAGLVFIATAALILGPLAHRVLHRFHLDRD